MLNIIWDLDDTLIDSKKDILFNIELALRDAFFDTVNLKKPLYVGPPIESILKDVIPSEILSNEKITEIVYHYRKHYDKSEFPTTVPFDGIEEIIYDTIHFNHYIVTNKSFSAAVRIIKKLGWEKNILILKSQPPNIEQRKTKTVNFFNLINNIKSIKSFILGIGDTKEDAIAAKNNDITSIGVLWGSGKKEELFNLCDYIFNNTKQLYDFLIEYNNAKIF